MVGIWRQIWIWFRHELHASRCLETEWLPPQGELLSDLIQWKIFFNGFWHCSERNRVFLLQSWPEVVFRKRNAVAEKTTERWCCLAGCKWPRSRKCGPNATTDLDIQGHLLCLDSDLEAVQIFGVLWSWPLWNKKRVGFDLVAKDPGIMESLVFWSSIKIPLQPVPWEKKSHLFGSADCCWNFDMEKMLWFPSSKNKSSFFNGTPAVPFLPRNSDESISFRGISGRKKQRQNHESCRSRSGYSQLDQFQKKNKKRVWMSLMGDAVFMTEGMTFS